MPSRRYTEEQFRAALDDPEVRTMADLCRAVGIVPRGANYETLRAYGAKLGVGLPTGGHRRRTFVDRASDDDGFAAAVAASESVAQVIRLLGGRPFSSNYRGVYRRIDDLGLDTSHFRGQGYSGGRTYPERWKPLEERLKEPKNSSCLRRALLRHGARAHRCEMCDREEWDGQPIPLELDHIDGDRTNNALENLRLLCPNCHALTPTYRGRNIGRYDPDPEPDEDLRPTERDSGTMWAADAPTLPFPPG